MAKATSMANVNPASWKLALQKAAAREEIF
jgi:hypothetical protein